MSGLVDPRVGFLNVMRCCATWRAVIEFHGNGWMEFAWEICMMTGFGTFPSRFCYAASMMSLLDLNNHNNIMLYHIALHQEMM